MCVLDFSDPHRIRDAYTRTVRKVCEALDAWEEDGMTGLILDFRKHSGGSMCMSTDMSFKEYLAPDVETRDPVKHATKWLLDV